MILNGDNKTEVKCLVKIIIAALIICLSYSVCAQTLPDTPQSVAPDKKISEVAVDPAISLATQVNWKIEDVQALRKQISESGTLPDDKKNTILENYDKAIAQLKLIEQYQTQKKTYVKSRQEAPAELEKIQQQLNEPVSDQTVKIPADLTVTELEQKVAAAKKMFEDLNKQALLLENEPKRRAERKAKIPEELSKAKENLNTVKEKLAAFEADPSSPELSQARKIVLQIQYLMHQTNIESLEEEQQYYDISGPLLTAQRDIATRKSNQIARELKIWEGALNEKRRLQADQIKTQAQQAVAEAKYAHPVIKQLAKENSLLAQLQIEVINEIESSSSYGKEVENQLIALEADFKDVQEQLKATRQITNVMGMLLLSKRGDLPDIRSNIEKIKSREGKAALAQLMWADYDKKWAKLADNETHAKEILTLANISVDSPDYADLLEQTLKLLQEQRKILRKISDDYLTYSETLAKNDLKERKFIEVTEQYAFFIDENILWVRSSSVLKPSQLDQIIPALSWLFSPSSWQNLLNVIWRDVVRNLLLYVLFALAAVGLLLIRKRTADTITKLTSRSDHKYSDSFNHTLKTLGLTILSSLPLPAIVLFIAWRIHMTDANEDFVQAVSMGLWSAGLALATYIFLRNFCAGGLGIQLGFSKSVLKTLQGHFAWFFSLIIPVVFMVEVYHSQQTDTDWHHTIGRLCFMIKQIVVAVFLLIVFNPKGKLLRDFLQNNKDGLLNRLRHLWYGACIVVPISFLVVAEMGYFYAAQNLHTKMVLTVLLVGLTVLVNAMMRRWFKVIQEKAEINQKRNQLLKAHKKEPSEKDDEILSDDLISLDIKEDAYKVLHETISKQAKRLIRLVNVLVILIGFWYIWKNVLPALAIFDDKELWTTTDAAGNPVVIDAGCLVKALLYLVFTIIMARNLPGILQVAILQKLPLNKGVRFATTAIFRYIIVITGTILTFNRIGFGWSKVQWLIAAISVGLGFGLQEIFANFVSGLIILFEQPIRVGDMVTIGDVNGRVTQIRIRATTLRKYDQKELIVPNKEFVTGRLINWTLSDRTLRMDFIVGVAYGSDIKKTEETLYRIAHQHPLVIHDDPVPAVIFSKFGDSSLEFQLRLFVPNMDNYLKVWHEINCEIDAEFRKENIEIAFPQRDLHLRSTDIPFPVNVNTNP